jgi:hypothetical protein
VLPEQSKKVPFTCGVCFDRVGLRPSFKIGAENSNIAIDSGFSSHGLKLENKMTDMDLTKCRVSEMYKELLFSENQQLAELSSKQLLTLVINFFPEKLSIIIEFTISKAYFCTGPENLGRYLSTLPTTTSTCIQQHIPD